MGGAGVLQTSFLSEEELAVAGIKHYGKNVFISRKASLYSPGKLIIGSNVRIDDFCILTGDIEIGSYVHIAAYCALYAQEAKIAMADFSALSARVLMYTFSDDYVFGNSLTNPTVPDQFKTKFDKGPITLQKHVLVGAGSIILPDTVIGIGAATGAFSLIRGELKPWTIYKGNPARPVGTRKSQRILQLERALREQMADDRMQDSTP